MKRFARVLLACCMAMILLVPLAVVSNKANAAVVPQDFNVVGSYTYFQGSGTDVVVDLAGILSGSTMYHEGGYTGWELLALPSLLDPAAVPTYANCVYHENTGVPDTNDNFTASDTDGYYPLTPLTLYSESGFGTYDPDEARWLNGGPSWFYPGSAITLKAAFLDSIPADTYLLRVATLGSEALLFRYAAVEIVDITTTLTDPATGITVGIPDSVLPDGIESADVSLSVTLHDNGTAGNTLANSALGSSASRFVVYDIKLLANSQEMQPTGNVYITLPHPEGFDAARTKAFYIADSATATDMNATDVGDTTVGTHAWRFATNHFSYYALAELAADGTSATIPATGDSTAAIIIACGALLVCGIAFIALSRRFAKSR
ncbi:MAG: hypothetical protein LBC35_06645 [Coriobacteriales bacterium]|jgi:hypothetical protein|nr:hypothetical protein [Coriobacteriales bacterium]